MILSPKITLKMQTKANNKKSQTEHFSVKFNGLRTLQAPYTITQTIELIEWLNLNDFIEVFNGTGEFEPEKIQDGIENGDYVIEVEITKDGNVKKTLKVTPKGLDYICFTMNENIWLLECLAETNDQQPLVLA